MTTYDVHRHIPFTPPMFDAASTAQKARVAPIAGTAAAAAMGIAALVSGLRHDARQVN